MHYGKRCDTCVALLDSKGPYFIKNQRKKLVHKVQTFKSTEEIRDGMVLFNTSKTHDDEVLKLTRTQVNHFSEQGKIMRQSLLTLRNFHAQMNKEGKGWKCASRFIADQFQHVYEKKSDKLKDSLVMGLLDNLIQWLDGKSNSALGEKTMNFFMMIHSISPQAYSAVAVNLNGPRITNLRKHIKKSRERNVSGSNYCARFRRSCENNYNFSPQQFCKELPCCFFCEYRWDKGSFGNPIMFPL